MSYYKILSDQRYNGYIIYNLKVNLNNLCIIKKFNLYLFVNCGKIVSLHAFITVLNKTKNYRNNYSEFYLNIKKLKGFFLI